MLRPGGSRRLPLRPLRRPAVVSIAAVATALLTAGPAGAAPTSDAEALARINASRVAIGTPAFTRVDDEMVQGCREYGSYVAQNPDAARHAHDELEGRPGFTALGRTAASRSQLVFGSTGEWRPGGQNPFSFGAPWHEMALLSPYAGDTFWRAATPGAVDCMGAGGGFSTFPGEAPPLDRAWVYPALGATGVPTSQDMSGEGPYPPTRLLGLPDAQRTGPNLYVFGAAALNKCEPSDLNVELTGPDGPVELWRVDGTTVGPGGERSLTRGGILLLPKLPLRPNSTYRLHGTVQRHEVSCPQPGGGSATATALGPHPIETSFVTQPYASEVTTPSAPTAPLPGTTPAGTPKPTAKPRRPTLAGTPGATTRRRAASTGFRIAGVGTPRAATTVRVTIDGATRRRLGLPTTIVARRSARTDALGRLRVVVRPSTSIRRVLRAARASYRVTVRATGGVRASRAVRVR